MSNGKQSPSQTTDRRARPLWDVVDDYVLERKSTGSWGRITAKSNRGALWGLAKSAGNPAVGRLNRRHVVQYLGANKRNPATNRRMLSVIRSFTRWAIERGYLRSDPAKDIVSPREPRRLPRGLPADDSRAIFAAAPDSRAELVLLLMLQEGLRRGEVVTLDLGDIDLREGVMIVRGKGGHQRALPVTDETRAAIDRYLRDWPATTGPLIRSQHDGRSPITPDHVGRLVSQWMTAAGVKQRPLDGRSPHALRHTAAHDMLYNGAHVRDVQQALGHVSLGTTQRYMPLLVGNLRDAMGGREYLRDEP